MADKIQSKQFRAFFFSRQFTATEINNAVKNGAIPVPTTLAECISLANHAKAKYNAHIANTSVHGAADATNPVATADATDLASLLTLANDIKAKYNAHRVLTAGSVHVQADTVNVVSSADATDLATAKVLLDAIKKYYNYHIATAAAHTTVDTLNAVTLTVGEWNQIFTDMDSDVDPTNTSTINKYGTAQEGYTTSVIEGSEDVTFNLGIEKLTKRIYTMLLQGDPANVDENQEYVVHRGSYNGLDITENGLPVLLYHLSYDSTNNTHTPKVGAGSDPEARLLFKCAPAERALVDSYGAKGVKIVNQKFQAFSVNGVDSDLQGIVGVKNVNRVFTAA